MMTIAGGILLALVALLVLPLLLPIVGFLFVVGLFIGAIILIYILIVELVGLMGLEGVSAIATGVISFLMLLFLVSTLALLFRFLKDTWNRNHSLILEAKRVALSLKPTLSVSAKLEKISALHNIEIQQRDRENAAKAYATQGHERLIVELVSELKTAIHRHLPESKIFISRTMDSNRHIVVSSDIKQGRHLPNMEVCFIRIESKPRTSASFDSTYVFTEVEHPLRSIHFKKSTQVTKATLKATLRFISKHPTLLLQKEKSELESEKIEPTLY